MNPNDSRLSSSTTFEVLGALWLRDKLDRIEHKLDLLLKVTVPPDQLIELTQKVDESKDKSNVLAQTIQENQ